MPFREAKQSEETTFERDSRLKDVFFMVWRSFCFSDAKVRAACAKALHKPNFLEKISIFAA
jgi:hypothetical protein